MAERDHYPVWIAMGAAFVGTLLGGGAVYMGMADRVGSLGPRDSSSSRASVEPLTVTEAPSESVATPTPSDVDRDPGDSPLVRAIETTRESVVTIEIAGTPAGAGVIYNAAGNLLTNHHVIAPALRASAVFGDAVTPLRVRFLDGRERVARVLAADPDEDVAILDIARENDERFAAAPLGRSSVLRLGEQVFAIGSPVGFEGTVATGIISALDRTEVLANRQLPVLQLDAAINFGNSGGPLFNLAGEIVGITTARSSRGEGIGFAIPIDRIRLFLQSLEQGIHGRSGVIGVNLAIHAEVAEDIEPLGYHSGVAVAAVNEGGAAAAVGVEPGDVIVSLRGRRHDELDASLRGREAFARLVVEAIRGLLPGESLMIEVVREGELVELELVVEAASLERQARIDAEVLLGLRLDESAEEPVIVELDPGSPIARMRGAEILIDARIVAVFHQPVETIEELGQQLAVTRAWAAGRGRRGIAIEFELRDGRRLLDNNFPLTGPR